MPTQTYQDRRGQLQTYFDHTAVEAWKRLTSDAPVSRIRETVRAGRDRMRAELLARLPGDLTGRTVLDAGCGTGAMALELARCGASVTAIDLSAKLVALAHERMPADVGPGRITFLTGDMLAAADEGFDHVVAMDSLIHYRAADKLDVLERIATATRQSVVFTFAPRTPALTLMHATGRLFPRADRAPAIEPLSEARLRKLIAGSQALRGFEAGASRRITSGFYLSQSMELCRR